jgi:tRNA pseudouridine38-40 synthase
MYEKSGISVQCFGNVHSAGQSPDFSVHKERISIADRVSSYLQEMVHAGRGCETFELMPAHRHLKLVVAYDGADFYGWQVQPGLATIQGYIAEAIKRVTGEDVLPQGSGRTDAGVHALAQVASVTITSPIPTTGLLIALNDVLPPSIRVLQAEEVSPDFHPRRSATGKTYRYRIFRGSICPPFLARYVYHHPYPLDESAMMTAAKEVEGEHDFTSFAAVDPERGRQEGPVSNVRTIFCSRWEREGAELVYTVRGSGFLQHMVRNLVGTFLLVGKGTVKPEDIVAIIEARNRSSNPGATAPATGLYLVQVDYSERNQQHSAGPLRESR